MGGSTINKPGSAGQAMRGRVTTPKPQQGMRGRDLIKPPSASLQPPMSKVNPPMAPNGMLNLNPMPQPMPQPRPPMSIRSPGVPSGFEQYRNLQDIPPELLNQGGQPPQQLTPEIAKQLGVLTGIGDFDEQGNRMGGGIPGGGMPSMSLFNPGMLQRMY
jgi:hypothetical protein